MITWRVVQHGTLKALNKFCQDTACVELVNKGAKETKITASAIHTQFSWVKALRQCLQLCTWTIFNHGTFVSPPLFLQKLKRLSREFKERKAHPLLTWLNALQIFLSYHKMNAYTASPLKFKSGAHLLHVESEMAEGTSEWRHVNTADTCSLTLTWQHNHLSQRLQD